MGRRMDALLGRTFKVAKLRNLVNLAVSRLAVLKNQRQVRCSQARSDVIQLLNLDHQDRALLRVEVVIKEQNMLDAFGMVESYCHLLLERSVLIENSKVCPQELDEAISGLIFAASRCGEFPELQEIREMFTSRYGKEFTARAVELRNNSGVNRKIVLKFSTQQPSLEVRMKVLKEIASENGITLRFEEDTPIINKDNLELNQKQSQTETDLSSAKLDDSKVGNEMDRNEQYSGSLRARKYRNVASAAQAAFESAATAAEAARAAVELSQSESHDKGFDDYHSSPFRQQRRNRSNEIQPIDEYSSESEGEGDELPQNNGRDQELEGRRNKAELQRSSSLSSSDSDGDMQQETKTYSNIQTQREPLEEITFDESENETKGQVPIIGREEDLYTNSEKVQVKHLNLQRKPISVRTRRGNGR
ncbi:hypothetical protein C5167_022914 [Papaver somniferum]|uniref:IST1-like protein n=1 Tax=Papaver somniferum TaxID=3469 RepID=A0A4Y7JJ67_PAPSO|nr:uncharacterized protein LOC113281975 [Papaver somniferum]RZC61154.1 hypothetical protein C5167_022914 [Papaver somniferum]